MKSFIDMAISFIKMLFSSQVLIKGKSCLLTKTKEKAHNRKKLGYHLLISAFVQDMEQAANANFRNFFCKKSFAFPISNSKIFEMILAQLVPSLIIFIKIFIRKKSSLHSYSHRIIAVSNYCI